MGQEVASCGEWTSSAHLTIQAAAIFRVSVEITVDRFFEALFAALASVSRWPSRASRPLSS